MRPMFYPFALPRLRYDFDSLAPYMSEMTLSTHYKCNHQGYVDTANRLLQKQPDLHKYELKELVKRTNGPLFNAVAQHWNHCFYWLNLRPASPYAHRPIGRLAFMMKQQYGSMDSFMDEFVARGKKQFGSGWLWLTLDRFGKLHLQTTSNAQTPVTTPRIPLITQDLWEHSYYIDYGCNRGAYLESFFHIVDWHEAEKRLNKYLFPNS